VPNRPTVPVHAPAVCGERDRLWQRWRELDKHLDSYAARRPKETVAVLEPRAAAGVSWCSLHPSAAALGGIGWVAATMKVLEGLKAIEPGTTVPVAELGLPVTGTKGLLLVFWKST
jgi:hypothetical protein